VVIVAEAEEIVEGDEFGCGWGNGVFCTHWVGYWVIGKYYYIELLGYWDWNNFEELALIMGKFV
jgi:hypothetical protein